MDQNIVASKKQIYNYSLEQLEEYFESINQKKFRAAQVFEWLYRHDASSFDEMSNINKNLREKLKEDFEITLLTVKDQQVSKDGTTKYLFELSDGSYIETVLMIMEYGYSVCVSSQVGCNMGCAFCASGLIKKKRDLTCGEMVAQVMMVNQDLKSRNGRVSHVVVMGTGEPFDNYDNVTNFMHVINFNKGLEIGARHITVSTCGLCNRIEEYAFDGLQTNLAISLHAPNDEIRDLLMPINKRYKMDQLREAITFYIEKTNRRVTLEYILIKDVNDQLIHARQLAHYLRGLNCYVNLIPYNEVDENGFKKSTPEAIDAFFSELNRLKIRCTIRKEHGDDIDGACGQLRNRYRNN